MGYSIISKSRLVDKVDSSWHRLSNHRLARERIFKAYLGDTHGLSAPNADRIPLNGHALYARSLIQYLAATQPKLKLSTDIGPWKPRMKPLSFQATRVMRDERFGFKQQRWVLDALMYSPGILKVCQEWRRVAQGDEGDFAEVLRTAVANVDASDWVFDTGASSVYEADFTGARIRMAVDDVLAHPMFAKIDEDVLRGMASPNLGGDERLFFENDDKSQPYRDMVTLWEIYDRCQNRIKIWPVDGSSYELYNEPWEGHDNGPYHYLDYLDVPNHVVGISPMCIVHNLIEATNRALSKTIAQTDAAKTIMRIKGGNRAEAEALMEALDGTGVYEDGGGLAEMLSVGGPDPRTMQMVPILKDLFNWLGGNINEMAGLGVSAPTATQGKLLSEAVSGMVGFMQARTNEAVRLASEAIVHNEISDTVGTELIPESMADGQTYWHRFTPEQRNEIDKTLIEVNIDVFSMAYKTPSQRLGAIMNWWQTFAMPAAPLLQQAGAELDIQHIADSIADMMDEPAVKGAILYSMPSSTPSDGPASMPTMRQSPNTMRTNVRMDRGSDTTDTAMMDSIGRIGEAA